MTGKPVKPSETELEILRVLWERGPCTVREVHELLGRDQKTVYTTILKLMQIMHQKDLVLRDESSRSHIYRAALNEDEIKDRFVDGVVDQMFGGSAEKLILHALSRGPASAKEIKRIRRLLEKMERDS